MRRFSGYHAQGSMNKIKSPSQAAFGSNHRGCSCWNLFLNKVAGPSGPSGLQLD